MQFQKENGRDSRNLATDLTLTIEDEIVVDAIGQRVWVFTSDCERRHVVVAQFVVGTVAPVPGAKGRYTVVAREGSTIKYGLVTGADAKPTIRALTLSHKNKIGGGIMAANTTQRLSDEDDLAMEAFAKGLNRATIGARWKLKGCA